MHRRPLALLTALLAPALAAQTSPPFAARCAAFAAWLQQQAGPLHDALLSGDKARVDPLGKELRAQVAAVVPGLGVASGSREGDAPFPLHLNPDKDRCRQLLGRALVAALPPIEGLVVTPWRAPSPASTTLANLGKTAVQLADFTALCRFDEARTGLVFEVHHELFARLGEADRDKLARLAVGRALGGAMEQRWLRAVTVLDEAPADDAEGRADGGSLRATAAALLRAREFDPELAPEQVEDTYFKPERECAAGSRGDDVVLGRTVLPDLIYDLQVSGTPETVARLAALGVTACFVAVEPTVARNPFDASTGEAIALLRDQLARELGQKLAAAHAGIVVGTADGKQRVYVDLLLFDGEPSTAIVKATVRAAAKVRTAQLFSFDPTRAEAVAGLK